MAVKKGRMFFMNKDELIKLKQMLEREREKYYRVIFEGIDNDKNVRFHLLSREDSKNIYSRPRLDADYSVDNEQNLVDYIENSLETIIRKADSKEMDFNTITVDFIVTLYISSKMFKKSIINDKVQGQFRGNDPDPAYRILSMQDFDPREIFMNISVSPVFSSDMNERAQNLLDQRPESKQVNYNKLASLLEERGFIPNAENMEELMNLQLAGKNLGFTIDFAKENKKGK